MDDLFRHNLAKLNAALIETVDIPDDALDKDFMLIQREEHTKRARI